MKQRTRIAALLLALNPAFLPAQSGAIEPGEPEILLPKVILEIEDLSVEKVEAKLPPEEALLPPERALPVLSEGELMVADPGIPPATGAAAEPEPMSRGQQLSTDIQLGTGMPYRLLGSVALKTLGDDPRFSILFRHETLDGFSGKPPGSGFNLRDDALSGSLKAKIGIFDTGFTGSFSEYQYGLQGLSPYVDRLSHSLGAAFRVSVRPLDLLTVGAEVEGDADSITLEGAVPLSFYEYRAAASLSAEADLDPIAIGFTTGCRYRSSFGSLGPDLNRFRAELSLGIDLPAAFTVEGLVGWFWNGAGLIPFEIRLTGTPFPFATLAIGMGYRVSILDNRDIISSHPLALPAVLADDPGWFGDFSLQLGILRDLSTGVKVSYSRSDAMLKMPVSADVSTGLFAPLQAQGTRLSSDLGLRWGISPAVSLSTSWTEEWLDRPFFEPTLQIRAELVGLDEAGRFGGTVSIAFAPALITSPQLPVLRLAGFWKISDAVKLQVDVDDLLWPLLLGPRWDVSAFESVGFRLTGTVGIAL